MLSKVLDNFCTGNWEGVKSAEAKLLLGSLMNPDALESRAFGEEVDFGITAYADIAKVSGVIRKNGSIAKLYSDALSSGFLSLPGFFSADNSECFRSYHVNNGTFLEFLSGGEIFYLVQVRTAFDGFYFPRFNLFYGVSLASVIKTVRGFVRALLLGIGAAKVFRAKKARKKLLGLWSGHPLPYHYFYDYLPGLHDLFMKGLFGGGVEVGGFTNSGYLDLRDFYPGIVNSRAVEYRKGAVYSPSDGFFVSSLRSPGLKVYKIASELDRYLNARAATLFFNTSKGMLFERLMSGCERIIWLGVLSGKRQWVEQADCFERIIRKAVSRGGKIGVVFDGMTSNYYERAGYSKLAAGAHDKIISSIISNFQARDVEFFSLNYSDPVEKLAIASKVHFFMSDAATSSIYVSRFCGVPGLIHSNGSVKGHIHKNAKPIPPDWVKASRPGDWQFSDYSIDASLVSDLFINLLYSGPGGCDAF